MTPLTTPIYDFSLGHKRSYDSDSDSVASENQPVSYMIVVWSHVEYSP